MLGHFEGAEQEQKHENHESALGRNDVDDHQDYEHPYEIEFEISHCYLRPIGRDRGDRRGLTNLKMLCGDALFLMRHVLQDASLRAVHILFPDPWPKKRHNKRRMFRPEFLSAVLRVLEDGGELNAASDHADYWQAILPEVAAFEQLEKQSGFALDERLPPGEVGHTNYEVKYRHSGRPIYQSTWLRRPR